MELAPLSRPGRARRHRWDGRTARARRAQHGTDEGRPRRSFVGTYCNSFASAESSGKADRAFLSGDKMETIPTGVTPASDGAGVLAADTIGLPRCTALLAPRGTGEGVVQPLRSFVGHSASPEEKVFRSSLPRLRRNADVDFAVRRTPLFCADTAEPSPHSFTNLRRDVALKRRARVASRRLTASR